MELKEKLKKYSMLASATIGGAVAANADINYTDINPDSVLAGNGDITIIDINLDGAPEIGFIKFFSSTTSNSYSTASSRNIVYFSNAPRASFSLTTGSSFLAALSSSSLIGASGNFGGGGAGYSLLGAYVYYTSYSPIDAGNWNNQTDKYIGVRYLDSLSPTLTDTTYGWIRVSTTNRLATVTFKDFAYQACPDVPIIAGDTGHRATSTASNVVLADIADNFDGSDLQLTFDKAANETLVGKYQILAVKASKSGTFTADSAMRLPASARYFVDPNGANFSGDLSALTTDTDGDPFVDGESYVVFVLSIPDGINATNCELSSPSNVVKLVGSADPVSNVVASDIANNGNGLDLQFNFDMAPDESKVADYQVMVVKDSKAASFDLDSADAAITLNRHITVAKTGSNLMGTFGATDTDTDGDLIAENVDYRVFVVSRADTNNASISALSAMSNMVTLLPLATPATNVVATDVADNGNGLDLQVTFDMASAEASLNEYNVIVVKASNAGTFDLDSANAAIDSSYHLTVPKTGSNLTANFGATDVDSDGDLITIGVDYVVFVVSVGTGGPTTSNISGASNNITLYTPADTASNVVASDVSNNYNSSDLQVAFDMATDENTISEYQVFVVKRADSAAFDLSAAMAVSMGNYLTVAKTGSNISTTFGASDNDVDGDPIMHNTDYVLFVMSVADGTNANENSLSGASNVVQLTVPITPVVTNIVASDVAENSNGTDLQITFDIPSDESGIAEYQAIAVKASKAGSFDLDSAEAAVTATNFLSIAKTGSNITATFAAGGTDSDGDAIVIGVDYVVFVLSKNDGSNTLFSDLSGVSNNITLNTTASVATNVVGTDATDNGNSSDLQVTFDMAADETTVAEYRVMAVKSANVGSFDLAAAEAVVAANYMSITPNGSNVNTTFGTSAKDVDGDVILQNEGYYLFVMSVYNGTTSNIHSLSAPSASVTLTVALDDPTNVVPADVANNNSPSDMEVSFDGISGENFIDEYVIIVVNTDAVAGLTTAQIDAMVSGGSGTPVTPDGSSSYTSLLDNSTVDEVGDPIGNYKSYNVMVVGRGTGAVGMNTYSEWSESIILTDNTGIAHDLDQNVSITSAERIITIQLDPSLEPRGSVFVHNALGQEVANVDIHSSTIRIDQISDQGVYVVSVLMDGKKVTGKVSIR